NEKKDDSVVDSNRYDDSLNRFADPTSKPIENNFNNNDSQYWNNNNRPYNGYQNNSVPASTWTKYETFAILGMVFAAYIFPLLGIIFGGIARSKSTKNWARGLGLAAIIVGAFFMAIKAIITIGSIGSILGQLSELDYTLFLK
ncbi:MAG: DUF4190 domain-containing protein, partial [Bacilli bacterium]|nr:DUF4190 domain-containing protein [Bacilli bacterium]